MYLTNGSSLPFTFENGEKAGIPPCNEEYEKSVFFRRLSPDTTDEAIRTALEEYGPLDYCYIAKTPEGKSMKIGRAKFRPVAISSEDAGFEKDARILRARQRAVDNAAAACDALDQSDLDGHRIRLESARPVDMKEYTRYGDY